MDLTVAAAEGGIRIREFEPADEQAVIRLFRDSADWFEAATGGPSADGDVQSLFYSLPDGASPDGKRVLVIAGSGGEVVGLIEAVTGHPGPDGCAVGLFLVGPSHRRRGWGRAAAQALLEQAAGSGITAITATNAIGWEPGAAFLRELGFAIDDTPVERGDMVGNRSVGPSESPVVRAHLTLSPPTT